MRLLSCFAVILCFVSSPVVTARGDASQTPVDATVTELVKKSVRFNGKRVRVKAAFASDGIERSALTEPDCDLEGTGIRPPSIKPQCNIGIVPQIKDGLEGHADIKALDNALTEAPSPIYKHITAIFTGTFVCKPSCTARGRRILEIDQVDELQVRVKDLRPHHPTPE